MVFFREEISHLIQKVRVGTSEEEMLHISKSYYELWIEIETNIIKDKDSVCQLFENLLKGGREVELYEDYAKSLVVFGALKDAKNVLKRYTRHKMGDRSREVYLKFIELYGTVDDQI